MWTLIVSHQLELLMMMLSHGMPVWIFNGHFHCV